jgi:hypothetical protein
MNCAGRGCAERDDCRRFTVRIPDGKTMVAGREQLTFAWGSFDIERQHKGTCQARAVIVRDWSQDRRPQRAN